MYISEGTRLFYQGMPYVLRGWSLYMYQALGQAGCQGVCTIPVVTGQSVNVRELVMVVKHYQLWQSLISIGFYTHRLLFFVSYFSVCF